MKKEGVAKFVKNLRAAKDLLEEVKKTPFEGVNVNVKRALISIDQALYDLGKEER